MGAIMVIKKPIKIRNSSVDFLIFTRDAGENGIEVRVQDGDVWLTQKALAELFSTERSVISKHLKKIYSEGELDETKTCVKYSQVGDNGRNYLYKFYSLTAIIAVGYRINSVQATQFRQWATKVLETFTKQGYVLDKDRLINGQIFDAYSKIMEIMNKAKYELIVIDDCSSDGTLDKIKKFNDIKVIEHTRNKCLGGARNSGVRKATGEYIIFLDGDDYLNNSKTWKDILSMS